MDGLNLADVIITGVHSVTTMYTPEQAHAHRRGREHWALVLKYEGETIYTCGGKEYLSDAGHVVLLPKGCTYGWHCTKAGHFAIIEFECAAAAQQPTVFCVKNSERIMKMIRTMEHARNSKDPLAEPECIRDTYSILLMLGENQGGQYLPSAAQQKISAVVEYISQHYQEKLTNEELAALTGFSVVYFRKLFTRSMGASPIAYIHALRITKAKEMLQSDHGTFSDIARSLGYPSLYDFSRDFKKHAGVSPTRFCELSVAANRLNQGEKTGKNG